MQLTKRVGGIDRSAERIEELQQCVGLRCGIWGHWGRSLHGLISFATPLASGARSGVQKNATFSLFDPLK